MGSKIPATEFEKIQRLVEAGVYLNTSDFVRDAIRDKLASIKVIKYRDVDYKTAKKEPAFRINPPIRSIFHNPAPTIE